MPNDSQIIINFISNQENTLGNVVSNSVGMALLILKNNYFTAPCTEADITKKYAHCIKEMSHTAKSNLTRKKAVDCLILQAQQPLNKLDDVNLYLPTDKNTYEIKLHTFPLKHVITLVWLALKDNDKFAHDINYQGTKEYQFTRARGDYNKRLDNFFNLLIEFQKDKVCHHGIRNEIVFLLNKIYLGIEIIESALSTIAATLKDHTNKLFWEHYQNAPTPTVKKSLTKALLAWISEHNPQPLQALVDPEKKAAAALHALFIKHGSNPETINLNQLIDSCIPTLNFNYDPEQYPIIKLIENIVNCADGNNNEDIARAFENIKTWIKQHIVLDDTQSTEKLTAFYTLYQAYTSLDQHMQMLLEATGNMQDSYSELKVACQKYFTDVANADLAIEFPAVNNAILQIAQQLKASIVDCKSNKMVDFIEKFFANWNLASNAVRQRGLAAKKYLYRFLIDEIFQEKIILQDKEIDVFWQSDNPTAFHDITVYQINRIFLHGLFVEPEEWSVKFGSLFSEILLFISQDFNNFVDTRLNKNLLETSYVSDLFLLLKSRAERYENPDLKAYPYSYIFLPRQVKTIIQWEQLSKWVSEEKLLEIYQPQAVRINQLVYSWMLDLAFFPLENALQLIPSQYRSAFLLEERVMTLVENEIVDSMNELVNVINEKIPEEERITIWKALSQKSLAAIHNTLSLDYWKASVESLPEKDRLTFLSLLKFDVEEYFNSTDHFHDEIWLLLPAADLLAFLKNLDRGFATELLVKYTSSIMDKFNLAQKIEFMQFVSSTLVLTWMMSNKDFLENLVASFGDEKMKLLQCTLIADPTVDLTQLCTSQKYWEDTFENLIVAKRLLFLLILGLDNYIKLFPAMHNLQFIADRLLKGEFYDWSVERHKLIETYLISNPGPNNFTNILSRIPEDKRLETLVTLNNNLELKSKLHKKLALILNLLPITDRYTFAEMACRYEDNFTPLYLSDPIPLITILELLPEQQRLTFLKKVGSEFIFNLLTTNAISWHDLEVTLDLDSDKSAINSLRKEFVKKFAKIYYALREGQTSFFKCDMVVELNILRISPHEAIRLIHKHAWAHPNSRTEKALSLMRKYSCYQTSNHELLKEIYLYSYAKSGLFKRSREPYKSFELNNFSYSSRQVEKKMTADFFFGSDENHPASRRAKIYNILNSSEQENANAPRPI
jgi:hypothetical protein